MSLEFPTLFASRARQPVGCKAGNSSLLRIAPEPSSSPALLWSRAWRRSGLLGALEKEPPELTRCPPLPSASSACLEERDADGPSRRVRPVTASPMPGVVVDKEALAASSTKTDPLSFRIVSADERTRDGSALRRREAAERGAGHDLEASCLSWSIVESSPDLQRRRAVQPPVDEGVAVVIRAVRIVHRPGARAPPCRRWGPCSRGPTGRGARSRQGVLG